MFNELNELFSYIILCSTGFFISFLLTGILVYNRKGLTNKQIEKEEDYEKQMIKRVELELFEELYIEEFEQLYTIELSDEFKDSLKEKTIELDVPNNKILMYYDNSIESFCYYTQKSDVLYKYLIVASRKYVIDYNCKKLHNDVVHKDISGQDISGQDISFTIIENCFSKALPQIKKKEKKTNKYIKLGTLDDYEKLVKVNDEHKPIHFLEYFLKTG